MNIAVIDIGTNSIHMLIARIDADLKPHVVDRAKEMVRLGEKAFENGRLDEPAMDRALDTLRRFRRLAERRGAQKTIAVATSAVREADNGGAFLQEIYRQTGIHPHLISGAEEARLVFKAVQSTMPLDERPNLVVDLGGGSVEFACGSARQFLWATSHRLGGQRLQALVLENGEPKPDGASRLREHVLHEIGAAAQRAKAAGIKHCYVTSGSAHALAKILRARGEIPHDSVEIPRKAIATLAHGLAGAPRDKRVAIDGLEPARADLIVGASLFFATLAEVLDVDTLIVSDRGLREGLVQDFVDLHGAELQWELTEPNARRREVLRFGERFQYDAQHHHHVAQLAVALFDATQPLHGFGEDAREMFEYAALLHDVGYVVSEKGHHKHSEYLILHGLSGGFTAEELRVVAALTRYHRKSPPKQSHENWSSLSDESKRLVERLGGLLRIADGLDRSHQRAVRSVNAHLEGDEVTLTLEADGPIELEVWAARRKCGWLEDVYNVKVRFEVGAPPASKVVMPPADA